MTTDNDDTTTEPRAATAGEVDHSNPDHFRGGEADPPRDPDEPFADTNADDDGADS